MFSEQIYGQIVEKSASFAFSQPVSRLSTPMPMALTSSSLSIALESPGSKKPRQASVAAMSRTENLLQAEKPSSSSNEPAFLYEMCPDGSLVRLRCPVCGAEKFRSVLGMVNHCRINCGLLIANPDDRIQQCGIPVV